MISPIMSRLRRRTFLLITGLILFTTLVVFSQRIGFSAVGELAASPFTANPPQSPLGADGDNKMGEDQQANDARPDSESQANKEALTDEEAQRYNDVADQEMQKPLAPMAYGTSSRPPFKDMPQIVGDLPRKYLLSDPDSDHQHAPGGKRLIFIGDVHGQLSALQALLKKLNFDNKKGDHLILTGDMINKGPDSPGVVQLAMDLGASAVRGNHEDRVILAHAAMQSPLGPGTHAAEKSSRTTTTTTNPRSQEGRTAERRDDGPFTLDNMEQEPFSHGDEADRAMVSALSPAQLTWLASLPVILRVGHIPAASAAPWDASSVAVAHAGLVPGVPLESQDPWAAMNMRTLVYPGVEIRRKKVRQELERAAKGGDDKKEVHVSDEEVDARVEKLREKRVRDNGGVDPDLAVLAPVDNRDGKPWSEFWDRKQNELEREERVVVVYGHDAKAGLQAGPRADGAVRYAYGLDTGCVYGRQLSALVVELDAGGVKDSIVQVDCQKAETKDE